MAEWIFGPVLLSVSIVPFFFMRRNQQVHDRLSDINNRIHDADIRDIYANRPYLHRRAWFDSGPTYDQMFWKFWKPVNSFHPELERMLEPVAECARAYREGQ